MTPYHLHRLSTNLSSLRAIRDNLLSLAGEMRKGEEQGAEEFNVRWIVRELDSAIRAADRLGLKQVGG